LPLTSELVKLGVSGVMRALRDQRSFAMATFDQFANQGGAAAGDESEVAVAKAEAEELLRQRADVAQAADFGGGPLGAHPEPAEPAEEDQADSV
jgi:hypothetical protein